MSIYKSSSLAMIPTAYKDGKLYSVRPNDGAGDFTFSRGSNLAATRVDVNGLIEKGRENRLLQSNQFDTTWVNVQTTETSGQSGYDGSNDAWKISATSSGSSRIIGQNNTSTGLSTFSVYAKAGNLNYLALENGVDYVYINLIDGSKGNSGGSNYITYSSTSVGGGWWRVSITFNKVASSDLRIYLASSGTSTAVNSGDYIYIQDAQLEAGLVATDYIETGASTAQAGILEDMPRLDYSGGASCPALLLEPQRSNEIRQSEYFLDWDRIKGGSVPAIPEVTTNYAISPEGVKNAARVQLDLDGNTTLNDYNLLRWQGMSAAVRTYSVYMKSTDGVSTYDIAIRSDNVETFEVTGEWQRFDMTSNTAQTYVQIGLRGTWNTSDSADILIYAAQGEQGSYPTSYIPTYGSSVTRSADSCLATSVSDLIGQTEGTLFAEFDGYENTGAEGNRIIAVGGGGTGTRIVILDSNTNIRFLMTTGGSTQVSYTSSVSAEGRHKVAIGYANNDVSMYIDGVQVATDTTATIPACSNIYIGTREDGGTTPLAGGIKQAVIFKSKLTDTELASLTTL